MSIDISIEAVSYRYGQEEDQVLNSVDFNVYGNDVFGLLGPNGAGKTTLMSIMVGILKPNGGRVSYREAERLLSDREIRSTIGYVPQDYAFYPELTPAQNLEYFGAMYDMSRNAIRQRVDELLEGVRLIGCTEQKGGAVFRRDETSGEFGDRYIAQSQGDFFG
jgi:ABC-2 type transport system ATP-binding protein